jgi:hypothetical protein
MLVLDLVLGFPSLLCVLQTIIMNLYLISQSKKSTIEVDSTNNINVFLSFIVVQDIDFDAQSWNSRKHNLSTNSSVGCVNIWSW